MNTMKETGLLCNPSQSCPILLSDVCQQVWEVPAEVNITSHYITLHYIKCLSTLHYITLHCMFVNSYGKFKQKKTLLAVKTAFHSDFETINNPVKII